MVADPQGHYIIIHGLFAETPVTLINVNLPNRRSLHKLKTILAKINTDVTRNLIVGGDFNMTHTPSIDRLWPTHLTSSRSIDQILHVAVVLLFTGCMEDTAP